MEEEYIDEIDSHESKDNGVNPFQDFRRLLAVLWLLPEPPVDVACRIEVEHDGQPYN